MRQTGARVPGKVDPLPGAWGGWLLGRRLGPGPGRGGHQHHPPW